MASDADGGGDALDPSQLELHAGLVVGPGPVRHRQRAAVASSDLTSRAALEMVLLEQMQAGPCAVQFSGGRDSSVVLAVAAHVAREHGLDVPQAITVRYPGLLATDETLWQERVVEHLGVTLQVVEVAEGADELTGSFARAQLAKHGARFPVPPTVMHGRLANAAAGRTLLTGEGGDEVLGPSRATLFVAHWRRRARPSKAAAREMVKQVMPDAVRRGILRRALLRTETAVWLRSAARDRVCEGLVRDQIAAPWRWDDARWSFLDSRACAVGLRSLDEVAAGEGFTIRHPLMHPNFVTALNGVGGARGLTTRTDATRLLVHDLLPEDVITRTSKATFNDVYAGAGVAKFARQWDGRGVDHDLVDAEVLRVQWMMDPVPAPALIPLQLAVLASETSESGT